MVKIRLKRIGSKKAPFYRVIVADQRTRRDGKPIEEVGFYNPRSKAIRLDREAIERWIKNGAQASETVRSLIRKAATLGSESALSAQ